MLEGRLFNTGIQREKETGYTYMDRQGLTVLCETKRNETKRNGTLRNDTLRNGTLRNGTLRNGTLRNGYNTMLRSSHLI